MGTVLFSLFQEKGEKGTVPISPGKKVKAEEENGIKKKTHHTEVIVDRRNADAGFHRECDCFARCKRS